MDQQANSQCKNSSNVKSFPIGKSVYDGSGLDDCESRRRDDPRSMHMLASVQPDVFVSSLAARKLPIGKWNIDDSDSDLENTKAGPHHRGSSLKTNHPHRHDTTNATAAVRRSTSVTSQRKKEFSDPDCKASSSTKGICGELAMMPDRYSTRPLPPPISTMPSRGGRQSHRPSSLRDRPEPVGDARRSKSLRSPVENSVTHEKLPEIRKISWLIPSDTDSEDELDRGTDTCTRNAHASSSPTATSHCGSRNIQSKSAKPTEFDLHSVFSDSVWLDEPILGLEETREITTGHDDAPLNFERTKYDTCLSRRATNTTERRLVDSVHDSTHLDASTKEFPDGVKGLIQQVAGGGEIVATVVETRSVVDSINSRPVTKRNASIQPNDDNEFVNFIYALGKRNEGKENVRPLRTKEELEDPGNMTESLSQANSEQHQVPILRKVVRYKVTTVSRKTREVPSPTDVDFQRECLENAVVKTDEHGVLGSSDHDSSLDNGRSLTSAHQDDPDDAVNSDGSKMPSSSESDAVSINDAPSSSSSQEREVYDTIEEIIAKPSNQHIVSNLKNADKQVRKQRPSLIKKSFVKLFKPPRWAKPTATNGLTTPEEDDQEFCPFD